MRLLRLLQLLIRSNHFWGDVMVGSKNKKKSPSAADFRKADIASTQAFNKAGDQPQAPSFSAGTTIPASLAGVGMNDLMSFLKSVGGGGGGMSAADRAQLALDRDKLRSANRQFNQEMGFKRQEFEAEQKRQADELLRRQGGLDAYIGALTGQIDKGPDVSALTGALSGLKTGAQTQITSAYDEMAKALKGITNPFAGYKAEAVASPTSGLEQFLSSQGVGTDDLTRFAQLQQAQSQQQAQAANNLMAQLGGLFTGAQQSRQAEMAQGRTADLGALGLNEMLLGTQIQQQGKSDIDKLREMLLAAQMQRAGL